MKKHRPCLRCGVKFKTSPEVRICHLCKHRREKGGEDCTFQRGIEAFGGHYASYAEALRGVAYSPTFTKPKRTRYYE